MHTQSFENLILKRMGLNGTQEEHFLYKSTIHFHTSAESKFIYMKSILHTGSTSPKFKKNLFSLEKEGLRINKYL